MAKNQSKTSEVLQIATLAGVFTAVGFALVTVVLVFFINPSKAEKADGQATRYVEITKFLSDPDLKILRQQAKTNEGEASTTNIREIIDEALQAYGLAFKNFPANNTNRLSSGLVEVKQTLTLEPAPLATVLQFAAHVHESKKTVHVASLNVTQAKRGDQKDLWNARIDFQDYLLGG